MCKPPHVEICLNNFWSLYIILLTLANCLCFSRTIKSERFRSKFCTYKNTETVPVNDWMFTNMCCLYVWSNYILTSQKVVYFNSDYSNKKWKPQQTWLKNNKNRTSNCNCIKAYYDNHLHNLNWVLNFYHLIQNCKYAIKTESRFVENNS